MIKFQYKKPHLLEEFQNMAREYSRSITRLFGTLPAAHVNPFACKLLAKRSFAATLRGRSPSEGTRAASPALRGRTGIPPHVY